MIEQPDSCVMDWKLIQGLVMISILLGVILVIGNVILMKQQAVMLQCGDNCSLIM